MHFLTTTLTLLSLTTSLRVLAAPLTFTDIERRWSAGESDVRSRPPLKHPPNIATPSFQQTNITPGLNPRHAQPPLRLPRLAPRRALHLPRTLLHLRRVLRRRHTAEGSYRQAQQ